MPKPGSRAHTPSDEMARFTDREGQQATFQRHLRSLNELQVLVFYGVGGTGKTWLLRKLREQVPEGIPSAYLDFDVSKNGKRYADYRETALQSIKDQFKAPTPRFDLALAMMHQKQGHVTESGSGVPWMDIAGDIVSSSIPGAGPVLKMLSKSAIARLKGTALEKLLLSHLGKNLVIDLRDNKTHQEIETELLHYLSEDLRESLQPHLNRAASCVIFFDTFEALGAGFQNIELKRSQEQWIRDLAANWDFALLVIAGQNRLAWDEVDPGWADHLDQHLVGGLSEDDARHFLERCDITSCSLQDCILSTSKESTGGYHCFSLGLCSDIVFNERNAGRDPEAESLRFNPQNWNKLAQRFLKSLATDGDRNWIELLALTPRFDEDAARWAHSSGRSADQNAAWKNLHGYSFVERLSGSEWFSIRAEMRTALKNQPSAQKRAIEDHQRWKDYWSNRSQAVADHYAGLAWYHFYSLDPSEAIKTWRKLAENARTAAPARMTEHSDLLRWLEPLGLLENLPNSVTDAQNLNNWGVELGSGSLNRGPSLEKAIACYEAELHFYTQQEFPQNWAKAQNNLGVAWSDLPTGSRAGNLTKAISCYEAALCVSTETEFPEDWAMIEQNLGAAWWTLPTGDKEANLTKAISYYEAALRVYTEQAFPQDWARVQNSLGAAWSGLPTADPSTNLRKSIAHYESALRIYTELDLPRDWAMIQNNLGTAWARLSTGDRESNFASAFACFEATLRVYSQDEFPEDWAMIQNNLGNAWSDLPTGERAINLVKAMAYLDSALEVYTEQDFPKDWARVQTDLGNTWSELLAGDRAANVSSAIACYEAALRVYTEEEFPREHQELVTKLNALGNSRSLDEE